MAEELKELHLRIHGLSNEELWRMLKVDSGEYRQVALDYAKSEINERGLSLEQIAVDVQSESETLHGTQWNEYRRRRNLFWLVVLTYLPGVVVIGIPLSRLFHSNLIISVTAGLWMLAFVVAANYLAFWKCPRCGKPFFWKWWYHNSFARRCVHCGLPKWSQSGRNGGSAESN